MFSSERVAQLAAEFTRREGGTINVIKLVKLIYLSDRASLARYGAPITYDMLVSMDHGPVPSRTLDMINGYRSEAWDRWMTGRRDHRLSLARTEFRRDDLDELSDADLEIVEEVWREFGRMNGWELSEYTHEHCPEWRDPRGSSIPIHERAIFRALGWSREDALQAQRAIREQRALDRAFERG